MKAHLAPLGLCRHIFDGVSKFVYWDALLEAFLCMVYETLHTILDQEISVGGGRKHCKSRCRSGKQKS